MTQDLECTRAVQALNAPTLQVPIAFIVMPCSFQFPTVVMAGDLRRVR
jgi:hypothetical protein